LWRPEAKTLGERPMISSERQPVWPVKAALMAVILPAASVIRTGRLVA